MNPVLAGVGPMAAWASIGRGVYRATSAVFLIVFASIIGAHLGTIAGFGVALLTGEAAWTNHGRGVGWTLCVAMAIIGIPTGHARFGNKRPLFGPLPLAEPEPPSARGPVRVEGRLKSLVIAPLLGAFVGLIVGGMIAGFFTAIYFSVALSPFGPGGWWPVLPLGNRIAAGGFSSSDTWWLIPWLSIVGLFVLAGALMGLAGETTFGNRRYEVFRSGQADNAQR